MDASVELIAVCPEIPAQHGGARARKHQLAIQEPQLIHLTKAPSSGALSHRYRGSSSYPRYEVLNWLHESRRDLALQSPANDGEVRGTFSLRTPVPPNPIGTSVVELVSAGTAILKVRGLDCLDGTPLVDLKPDRALFVPLAPAQPGDFETDGGLER